MHFLWKSPSFRLAAAPGQEAASPESAAPTLSHASPAWAAQVPPSPTPPQPTLRAALSPPRFPAVRSPLLEVFKQEPRGHLSHKGISATG